MHVFDVRNNHLNRIIQDIFDFPGDYVDEALIDDLKRELMLSTFICPDCGVGLLRMGGADGGNVLPAFTDMENFDVEFADSNIIPSSFEFNEVKGYLDDEDFEGIVVNPHIDNFFVSREMISDVLTAFPSFTRYEDMESQLTDGDLLEIFHEKTAT